MGQRLHHKPRLTTEEKTIICRKDNFVPLVDSRVVRQCWKQLVFNIDIAGFDGSAVVKVTAVPGGSDVIDVPVSPSSVVTELCDFSPYRSLGEYVEPQSFSRGKR